MKTVVTNQIWNTDNLIRNDNDCALFWFRSTCLFYVHLCLFLFHGMYLTKAFANHAELSLFYLLSLIVITNHATKISLSTQPLIYVH